MKIILTLAIVYVCLSSGCCSICSDSMQTTKASAGHAIVKETTEKPPVENLDGFSNQKEKCSSCARIIAKSEQDSMVDKKIACKECNAKKAQAKIAEQIPDSQNYRKPNEAEPNVLTLKLKILHCKNCGREIDKSEKAYVFARQIVCSECFARLKKQP